MSSPAGGLTSPVDLGGGEYTFSWTAPLVTRQTYFALGARASIAGYDDASSRTVFLVDPNKTMAPNPTQIFLHLRPSSTSVRPGGTIDVTLFAYTIEGYIISGATIVLLLTEAYAGTLSPVRVSGCGYTFTFTASPSITSSTGVLITISASKFGYASGLARLSVLIIP